MESIPLAIARTTGAGALSFADGSVGVPYILARGEYISPIKCGDGIVDATEECDDGNTAPNDGCSEKCKKEVCGDGIKQTAEECDLGAGNGVGTGCNNCKLEGCGNGILEAFLTETCDDGNTASCDGCDSLCHVECGNGKIECSEECDDGGLANGDGCDKTCKMECGNGVLDPLEQCDDGNRADADGCSSTCSLENMPPDCTGGTAVATTWPPNQRMETFAILGVTDPDADPVTIQITAIAQNEAAQTSKGDKFCPDASLAQRQIRVERNGPSAEKNGRTYRISFEADDGKGGRCTGTTRLCVPHDQYHNCHSHDEVFVDSTKCPGYAKP
jgi:cysteine-rich repeat protein